MKASKFSDAQKAFILKPESIYFEVRRGRNAGRGHLPQGWDQPSDLFQLKEEVRRAVADRDAAVKAARG
jgi:hypothetical protein